MEFIKKNLDALKIGMLSVYVLFLLFAVLDEQLGWKFLSEWFY